MAQIYAIGDIHGHLSKLETALQRIAKDGGEDAKIVFLGDYIDRGPESSGVLDLLSEGRSQGRNWVFLKGNHDAYLNEFLTTGMPRSRLRPDLHWFDPRLGGAETLASYGLNALGAPIDEIIAQARDSVPKSHQDFLQSLELMYQTDDMAFMHAGIRPGVPLDQQVEEDLIWIRKEFLEDRRDHGKLIVHGHTALRHPEHCINRVNLDGGAGFGYPLFPAVFENGEVFVLTAFGREALVPSQG